MTTDDSSNPPDTLGLPPVITIDELAELLRLDRKTVYVAAGRGEVPGVLRFGRAIRVSRDAVLKWLIDGQGNTQRKRRRG